MSESKKKIAERLFDAKYAECALDDALERAGVTCEKIGWDDYDCSLELYDMPPDFRLSADAQRVVHDAGFVKCYVNHTDKWETHYTFGGGDFVEVEGWRVSYPHKRGADEKGIYVEKVVEGWPKDWFETGYCQVKSAT